MVCASCKVDVDAEEQAEEDVAEMEDGITMEIEEAVVNVVGMYDT